MAGRGRYAKGEAKRAEILEVALAAVAQHGYRRTYVSEIADRVGLTQAGLFHHFRTREQLYEEVLRTRDEHDRIAFAERPPGIEGFLAVIAHNQSVPGLVQLYAEFSAEAAHPEHPSHSFFVERCQSLRDALTQDVKIAQADGEASESISAELVAQLMIAAADGLQEQWRLDRSIDMVDRLRHLWRSLCSEPAASSSLHKEGGSD